MGPMGSNATRTITALAAGSRTLTLTGGPSHCLAVDPIPVTIPSGGTATATVKPTCAVPDTPPVPGQITGIATTTGTGGGTDADGYQVLVDGVRRAALLANGVTVVNDLPGATPTVLALASVSGNCRAAGALPLTFALNAARAPISTSARDQLRQHEDRHGVRRG